MGNSGSHCLGKYTICILNLDLLGLRLSLAIITTKLKNIICHFLVCIFFHFCSPLIWVSLAWHVNCRYFPISKIDFVYYPCMMDIVSALVSEIALSKTSYFSFNFFCHLFKVFLFSFLFNFVWNILCRHLGLNLLLTI